MARPITEFDSQMYLVTVQPGLTYALPHSHKYLKQPHMQKCYQLMTETTNEYMQNPLPNPLMTVKHTFIVTLYIITRLHQVRTEQIVN